MLQTPPCEDPGAPISDDACHRVGPIPLSIGSAGRHDCHPGRMRLLDRPESTTVMARPFAAIKTDRDG